MSVARARARNAYEVRYGPLYCSLERLGWRLCAAESLPFAYESEALIKEPNPSEHEMSTPTLERAPLSAHTHAGVGKELIVELWDPKGIDLTDKEAIRAVLLRAVRASGSTLIRSFVHHLNPGVTGFALLKESHISIHTWPELGYAAFDFFTCGKADSYKALDAVKEAFRPESVKVTEIMRGARD